MPKNLRKIDMVALLAIAGVTTTGIAQAASTDSAQKSSAFKVVERQEVANNNKEAACGKGSCGTDEAGAKAAQEKHAAAKHVKKPAHPTHKKVEKQK